MYIDTFCFLWQVYRICVWSVNFKKTLYSNNDNSNDNNNNMIMIMIMIIIMIMIMIIIIIIIITTTIKTIIIIINKLLWLWNAHPKQRYETVPFNTEGRIEIQKCVVL